MELQRWLQVTADQNKLFELGQGLADRLGLGPALSPDEQAKLAVQEKADRVDAVATVNDFSQALGYYDRKDYDNAV